MTTLALLATLVLSILVALLVATAQPTGKMPRLSVLLQGPRTLINCLDSGS